LAKAFTHSDSQLQTTNNMNISVYLALSVNGMISNKKNVPDWLSDEFGSGFMSICERSKAVIMGKTTYNILAPDNLPLTEGGTLVVLTTDTTAQPDRPGIIFTDKSANEIVTMLESLGHNEAVIIGGALTLDEFLKAGLVDEFYLVVEPVLFGGGLPLLKNIGDDYKLILSDMQKLNDNTVQLHYHLKK
jgi:dihydrofolate reductase